jgi:hypothetical protein
MQAMAKWQRVGAIVIIYMIATRGTKKRGEVEREEKKN